MIRKPNIETPVILLLFAVFAVLVMSVITAAANVYRSAEERDGAILDGCIAKQYLTTKLWRLDGLSPTVRDLDGNECKAGPGLEYYEDMDGTLCRTMIYFHDGQVYEDFTLAGLDFAIGNGQSVLRMEDLVFERTEHGIAAHLTLEDGRTETIFVGFRSGGG